MAHRACLSLALMHKLPLPHPPRTQSMSLRAVSLNAAAQCSQPGRACTSMVMAAPGADV